MPARPSNMTAVIAGAGQTELQRALQWAVESGRGQEDSNNSGSVSRAMAVTEKAVADALEPERESARRLYEAVMKMDRRTPEVEAALAALAPTKGYFAKCDHCGKMVLVYGLKGCPCRDAPPQR